MSPLIERAQAALEVLREWQSNTVTAAVDTAVASYQWFAEIASDPRQLSEVDSAARCALLLEMAEVGATQVARLAREADDGTSTSRAGRQLQEALGRILRAAGRELWDRTKREAR